MSTPHYLRVEGVNLSAFVFDTRDLSTTRGGSLMLLDAVGAVAGALGLQDDDESILSRGASSGLFRIDGDPEKSASNVRKALSDEYPHATFVVDVVPAGDFQENREQLLAANRWRQMQAATLAVPPENQAPIASQPACDLDGLRPVGTSTLRGKRLSENTAARREYGREQKQRFYERAAGLAGLPAFAHDFESIAVGSKPLDGKLAVFYADGNGFGGIQASQCASPEIQRQWDTLIREARKSFLASFFSEEARVGAGATLDAGSPWRGVQRGETDRGRECLRFETLIWGGDEVMFVMPAALGWRFASFFFEKMRGMTFAGQSLTHAAALVFCQHHSPIHRIKRLAQGQMAEFAKVVKDAAGNKIGRSRDSLVVLALESFDHLGTGYEEAMRTRYRGQVDPAALILHHPAKGDLAAHLGALARGIDALRGMESFARSQLRGLVSEILAQDSPGEARQVAEGRSAADANPQFPPPQFRNADDEAGRVLGELLQSFSGDRLTLWLQLEELWDYARP